MSKICMLDGPDYPSPNSFAKTRHEELLKENERLRSLLLENGISWAPERPRVYKMRTRTSITGSPDKQLPHLPMEIQLRILGFAMQSRFPIIDPFSKARLEHLTKDEQVQRKKYPTRTYIK